MYVPEEELRKRILSVLSRHGFALGEAFLPGTPIKDLGLDSLDTIHILFALEEEFGIEVDGEGFRDVSTVGQIFEMISQAVTVTKAVAV